MKRNLVIATVAAAALIGGGSAFAFAGSDDAAPVRSDSRTQQAGSQVTLQADDAREAQGDRDANGDDDRDDVRPAGAKLTAAQAVEAALKHQSGTAVSAELDDDSDDSGDSDDSDDQDDQDDQDDKDDKDDKAERLAWEVDVLGQGDAWHTVHIDAATGKVLGTETEDERDDAGEARTALKDATTDLAKAAQAASAKGFVTSIDLDDDDRSGHVSEGWEIETADSAGSAAQDRDWNVDVRTGKLTADHDDRHDHDD
ncbi:PepSY domain-containing protein [Streptomyces sp. B-S-A8]|uniref:PepSY domain-containing protein n=1 Tax=Streptomyces solicavernae TaxID=3043614 RepID=A0ABT6RKK2_9ACTN|nr:PepSY domain-containing protein [Streptomyces sp. B-S-A8]MDI3384880.1 PepSY domain-containing protein [Streptomyces sp. B-S-A8]